MEIVQDQHTALQELKTALRHSLVYGVGNMLSKAIGFFMLPFYTHYLTPENYGVLEILDLSMSLLGMFLTMGLIAAVLRRYAAARTNHDKNAVISSAFLFVLATGLVTFSVGCVFVPAVSKLMFGPGIPPLYLFLSFATLVCTYMTLVPRTYLRALEKSTAFTVVDNLGLVAMLSLNIYFIAVAKLGVLAILLSSFIVGVSQLLILSTWASRRVGLHFNAASLWQILRFGVPLTFSNLGLFALNFSDRFFLKRMTDLSTVGTYAVSYKFAYMMNFLVVQPFFVMWQARMYKVHAQPNYERIFGQIFRLYALLLTFLGLGLSLFSPEIVHTMVRSSFFAGQAIIPIVVLAYVFWGIGFYGQTGMFLTNHTRMIGILGAAAAMLNLPLNYLLIRRDGMLGAAWATLLSFAALALGSFALSHRVFPMHLGTARVALGIVSGILIYGFSTWHAPTSLVAVLLEKAGLLVAFPVLLWQFRIIAADERHLIRGLWKRGLARFSPTRSPVPKKDEALQVVSAVAVDEGTN